MLKKLIPVLIGGASYIAPHAIGNWAAKQIQVPRRKLKGKNQLPEPDAFWQLDQGCVRLWGSSEQPVALLIHGWEGHHSQLHSIGSALLRKGFDVVMVDPPAHGDAAGDRASPQHFADTLKAVEKLVGPIQLLIGHSMGGLAATLAINQGLAVPYLVTVSTPADAGSTITGVADWLRLSQSARRYMHRGIEAFAGIRIAEVDTRTTLASFQGEMLITHDRGDRFVPVRHALQIKKNYPRGELFLTEGLGHSRLLQDSALLAKILHFAGADNRIKVL